PEKIDDIKRQMEKYEHFLYFKNLSDGKSIEYLRTSFFQIKERAKEYLPPHTYIYTDIEVNNVIVLVENNNRNKEFIDSIQQYNPIILDPREPPDPLISKRQDKVDKKLITINIKINKHGGGNSGGPLFNYIDLFSVNIVGIYVGDNKNHSLVSTQPIELILSTARLVFVDPGEGSGTKGG
ncbi:26534_t:CDS:2, partial [Racocetra persica]